MLPAKIKKQIPGKILFATKAKRRVPLRRAITTLVFGVLWLAGFSLVMIFLRSIPLWSTLLLILAIIIGFFIVARGLYDLFAEGSWFVGNEKNLYEYRHNRLFVMPWSRFAATRIVNEHTIAVAKRSGHFESTGRGRWGDPAGDMVQYVPDTLYIIGAQDILEVKKKIEKKLKT
jgi:hypothetical protein